MDAAVAPMPSSSRRPAAILIGLAILPFLVFLPLALGQATLARGGFLEQNYPLRLFAAQTWASGIVPLWDPHINGGQPALADFLTCALYPPQLLTEFLSLPWGFPPRAMEFEALAHLSLAGIFVYLLVRKLLGSDLAGVGAAFVYVLGGYATSYPMEQTHIFEAATWLPLILLFVEMAFRDGKVLWYVGAGIWLGLCLLAGHPQTAMYIVMCLGLFWLWRLASHRHVIHYIGPVYLGLAAATIALPQIVPFAEFATLSTRNTMSYATSAVGMAPAELWALLAPVQASNSGLYVGLPALALAPLGFLLPRLRRDLAFWALLAALAVLFALGGQGPVFPTLHSLIPGLGLVRQQERMLLVFSLAMGVLAGGGLQALAERGRLAAATGLALIGVVVGALVAVQSTIPPAVLAVAPRLVIVVAAGAICLAVAVLAPSRGRIAALAVLAVLLADLWTSSTHTAVALDRVAATPAPDDITRFLQARDSERGPAFRISSEGLLPGGGNAGILFGLEDLVGSTPMMLNTYHDVMQEAPELTWWRMMNVRYVVTRRTLTQGALSLVQQQGEVNLYELWSRLPRAWLVHRSTAVRSPAEARLVVKDAGFAPERVAVVEGGEDLSSPVTPGKVRLSEIGPTFMRLQLQSGADGYVLVSQNYYPGWIALVDGRPVSVLRANGWQPAIPVSPGAHSIILLYFPGSFLAGLALSLLCAGLLFLGFARWPRVTAD